MRRGELVLNAVTAFYDLRNVVDREGFSDPLSLDLHVSPVTFKGMFDEFR